MTNRASSPTLKTTESLTFSKTHKKISFYYFLAYEANSIVATHYFHNKRGA